MEEKVEMSSLSFEAAWTAKLLDQICLQCTNLQCKHLLQACSEYHFKQLNMEELLRIYIGDLEGFIEFITAKWGWKITYDRNNNVILADENKNYCVCPIVQNSKQKISSVLCHCSEGFAQRMFSYVIGKEVTATVVQSVLFGDSSCVYRIQIN